MSSTPSSNGSARRPSTSPRARWFARFVVRESAESHRLRPHSASHRLRRLVVVRAVLRAGTAVQGRLRRHPGPARARGVVSRIRRRAVSTTTTYRPRRPTRSTGRRSIRPERRSSTCPSTGPDRPSKTYRRGREHLLIDDELYAALKQRGREVRSHALRDAARGVRGARVPPLRPVGFRGRHSARRAAAPRRTRRSSRTASIPCPLRARLDPDGSVRRAPPQPVRDDLAARPGALDVTRSAACCAGCTFPGIRVARRSSRSPSASTGSARRSISAT